MFLLHISLNNFVHTLHVNIYLDSCYLLGDVRVNENPNLAIMHTLFVREHNRIAKELKDLNSQWSDEILFQETKRIVNAQYQYITYNEWYIFRLILMCIYFAFYS